MDFYLSSHGTPEADAKAAADVLWHATERHGCFLGNESTDEVDIAIHTLSKNRKQCMALLQEAYAKLTQAETRYQQLESEYITNQMAHRRSSMFPDARLSKNLDAARRHREKTKAFIAGLELAAGPTMSRGISMIKICDKP
jgi:hypothetical protein